MCNHLVFRHYPITCHFRKIKTLGSTEPAGIVGGELFGSVTVKFELGYILSLVTSKHHNLLGNFHVYSEIIKLKVMFRSFQQ